MKGARHCLVHNSKCNLSEPMESRKGLKMTQYRGVVFKNG